MLGKLTAGVLIAVVSTGCVSKWGMSTAHFEKPTVIDITPASATPNVQLELSGYRLGLDKGGARVLFMQGEVRHYAESKVGCYELANLSRGLQHMNVMVPDGVRPGPCQIVVDVAGQCSEPKPLEIGSSAIPPILTCIVPPCAEPGDSVWVHGTGFSPLDDFELTDAHGKVHQIRKFGTSSSALSNLILVPTNFPDGVASLRVVERRSGANQPSNPLPLRINRGPVPLCIMKAWLKPVAPGQWLDLVVAEYPQTGATRIEFAFRQKDKFLLVTKDVLDLHVQVPQTLVTGDVEILTRTWVGETVSEWSQPVAYRILDRPAEADIYSMEIVPVRAEVAFRADDGAGVKTIVLVDRDDYPCVHVPLGLPTTGAHIETRIWRGGQVSPWLPLQYSAYPAMEYPNGMLEIERSSFINEIPIGPDTPPVLSVYKGEWLILTGRFPVESIDKLEVVLSRWLRTITLKPMASQKREVAIRLPEDLTSGDWRVSIRSVVDQVVTRLPFTLRVK